MRLMLNITLPHEPFNTAVRNGSAGETLGKILEAIPTNDLYYLKSVCDQAAARGNDFSKRFWWEVDPKKHHE